VDQLRTARPATQPGLRTVCRSKPGFGYAACVYSLIRPWRIFLRCTRAARSTTGVGAVAVALGGRWRRPWCGLCSL
jgi:hypothetical protein